MMLRSLKGKYVWNVNVSAKAKNATFRMMATNMHAINVQEQKKNVRSVQTDHKHVASWPLHLGNSLLVELGELQLWPQQKPEVHLRQSKIGFQR